MESLGPFFAGREHCALGDYWTPTAGGNNGLERYRLRLFVHRGDLLPVTRSAVRRESGDGRLGLRAGVPLTRGRADVPGSWVAHDGKVQVELPFADAEVGLAYALPGWDDRLDVMDDVLDEDTSGRWEYRGPANHPLGDGRAYVQVPGWQLVTRQAGGKRAFALVRNAKCVQARVPVSRREVVRLHPDPNGGLEGGVVGGVIGGVMGCRWEPPERWVAEAGARVYWEDGRRAGSLLVSDELQSAPRTDAHGRRCFDVQLGRTRGQLGLCFDPEEVRPAKSACPGATAPEESEAPEDQ